MTPLDDVKAILPGWHITEANGLVDADLGPVNVEFHTVGQVVVARVFVGVRAVAGGTGATVDLAMAGLRAELGEIEHGCVAATAALRGTR
jgi:hypothetical protein